MNRSNYYKYLALLLFSFFSSLMIFKNVSDKIFESEIITKNNVFVLQLFFGECLFFIWKEEYLIKLYKFSIIICFYYIIPILLSIDVLICLKFFLLKEIAFNNLIELILNIIILKHIYE
jgi:hypothetical protein